MGKAITRTIKGMSFKAKLLLIVGLTTLATLAMLQGWYGLHSLDAAIGTNSWSTLYSSATYPTAATATYSVPSGTNRLLVVAVSSARTAVGTQSYTLSYGGQALTRVNGNETSSTPRLHSALYYLNEAGIAAATNTTFTMTVSGGTSTYTHIMATTYTGVNQSAPITNSQNYSSGTGTTATPTFPTALTEAAGDQPVVIMNSLRTASTTARTHTAATNWSIPTGANLTGANTDALRSTGLIRTSPTTATTNTTAGTISTASLASMVGMSLAAAPTGTTLTVSASTPVASGTRLDSDNGVLMQRLTATASGALVLNSLTLDDAGTASSVDEADVYISPTSATTLPADAVLIGKVTSWGGTSTAITLDQGTTANRTLGGTEATTKYLYITYDMTPGQATKTVQSKVTAVGVVSPNTGATGLSFASNTVTLDYSGNLVTAIGNTTGATNAKDSDVAVLMQHFQVDCSTGFDGALELSSLTMQDLGNVTAVGAVKVYIDTVEQATLPTSAKLIGSISDWNRASTAIPLVNDYGATNADRTVVAGVHKYLYVVYSMNYVDDALWATTGKVVQSQVTAVGAASPDGGASGLTFKSNSITLTRGTWSKITSCGGCHDTSGMTDSAERNVPNGKFPGSHYKHATVGGQDCSLCHIKPSVYKHANGNIDMATNIASAGATTNGTYSRGTSIPVSNATVTNFGYCSNIDCHSNGAGGTKQTGDTRSLGMGNTAYWGTAGTCDNCHGMPPAYANKATDWGAAKANSHSAHSAILCSTCHSSVTTLDNGATYTPNTGHADGYYTMGSGMGYTFALGGGTCATPGCHSSAQWGGASLGCTDCHAVAVASNVAKTLDATVTTRGAVVSEFTNTWSHKRSFTGTPKVVNADCIVCHMEGNPSTGRTSGTHGDGYVNLRDPDTGANIQNVTFGGATFGSYTTSTGSTDVKFVRFKRDFSKRFEKDPNWLVLAAVQRNHCLKCHDSDGAGSTLARVAGATSGLQPFGVAITGHVAPFDSNGSGNVVNVKKSFDTSNSSYHPVRGRQNNWYAKYSSATAGTSNLIAPWTGPYSTRGATVSANAWGNLISCWDCHAPAGTTYASGTVARSVTAHGATATLRAPVRAGSATVAGNLCLNCHRLTYSNSTNHGANSAYTTGASNMNATTMSNCSYCHAYSSPTATGLQTTTNRPLRAEDVHGFNDRTAGTVGSKWATSNIRPYGFIRNGLSYITPASTTASGETITGAVRTCKAGTSGSCTNSSMSGTANILGVGGTY